MNENRFLPSFCILEEFGKNSVNSLNIWDSWVQAPALGKKKKNGANSPEKPSGPGHFFVW
jgi:hypothetical protein